MMSTVKLQDMQNTLETSELEQVKGGRTVPTEQFSLNYERIRWTY